MPSSSTVQQDNTDVSGRSNSCSNGNTSTTIPQYSAQEEKALQWKELGNTHYSKRRFDKAAEAYQCGLDGLVLTSSSSSSSSSMIAMTLRSNLAMVFLKLEQYAKADQECSRILQVDPNNTKGKKEEKENTEKRGRLGRNLIL